MANSVIQKNLQAEVDELNAKMNVSSSECQKGSSSIVDNGSIIVKKVNNIVELRGAIHLTSDATSQNTAFSVSSGYKPTSTAYGIVVAQTGDIANISISTSGIVTCAGMVNGVWNTIFATYII